MTSSIKNFFLSLGLLILVVSLFFIPEILGLYRSLSGGEKKVVVERAPEIIEPVRKASRVEGNDLDKILALLSSGYLENPSGMKASMDPKNLDPKMLDSLGEPRLTWANIRTPAMKQALSNAQKEARAINVELDDRFQKSKFALLTFSNGVAWLQKAEPSATSPEKALAYIEQLDLDVTKALIEEQAERSEYVRWSRVSLGPLLSGSRAAREKMKLLIPYRPGVTIVAANLRRPGPKDYYRYVSKGRNIPTSIRISGFVMGKDTDQLVLYRNGLRISKISLKKKVDDEGKRTFKFSANRGEGIYTVRAVDKFGSVADYHYLFFPRADQFPRRSDRSVALPFRSVIDVKNFSLREIDPRLNRFFLLTAALPEGVQETGFNRF